MKVKVVFKTEDGERFCQVSSKFRLFPYIMLKGGFVLILLLGRRIYRLLVIILIMVLVLPLLQYYIILAVNPQFVQFGEPRGAALKVLAEVDNCAEKQGGFAEVLASLHEFYQNGL